MSRGISSQPLTRVAAAGAALTAALGVLAHWGNGTPWPALPLWVVAFGVYLWAWSTVRNLELAAVDPGVDGRRAPVRVGKAVWACAVVVRLALLPAEPALSEDIYRYVWDGLVQLGGVNPFLHPPGAEALAEFRTSWSALINHPGVPTIYPPGAQAVFAGLAAVSPSVLFFKLAWVGADLGVAGALSALAKKRGVRLQALVLYLWSPLLITEVAWNGHLEPLALLPLVAGIALAARPQPAGATRSKRSRWLGTTSALFGLGAAVKFAPLAGVFALVSRGGWPRRDGWLVLAAGVLPLAGLYAAYAAWGLPAGEEIARMFTGLRTYAANWEFNPGLWRPFSAMNAPRWIALVPAGLCLAVACLRRWPIQRSVYWVFGLGLAFQPTLHPWYLLWMLPLAALRGSGGWILYTGTIFLAYQGRDAYLATGSWPEPWWLVLLIHLPPLALLSRELMRELKTLPGHEACRRSRGVFRRPSPTEIP